MHDQVTRSVPSASTATSATSAESIPPDSAEHDALEAVLVDVVAHARDERRVDLRVGCRAAAAIGAAQPRSPAAEDARAVRAIGGVDRRRRAAPPRGGACRAGARRRSRRGRSCRAASPPRTAAPRAMISPSWSIATLWPSKTSSSWPPTSVAEEHRGDVVAGALGEHPLALEALAGVVGRGRQVHDHLRARQRLVGRRRPGLPDVLADRDADGDAVRPRSARRAGPDWK